MKKYFESGRSMVEILGVLAVVGVLSIGGISGYKYGMNKYRANETINELQIRALSVMQQVSRGEIVELNMEMGDKTKLGYTVDAWIKETDPKYFYIALENVPSAICKQILKEKWITPTTIYVGNSTYYGYNEYICGNDMYAPSMDFEFYRDFAENSEYIEITATHYDPMPYVSLVQHSCSDSDNPLGDIHGHCYACDRTDRVEIGSHGQCSEICPNRIKVGNYCHLNNCSSDEPLMDTYGNCYACSVTDQIYVQDGQCTEVCSNRVKSAYAYCALSCSADKPLMNNFGNCYACNSTSSIYVGQDGQCSEICSNRVKSQGGYCILACAADTPLVDTSGYCYACNSTSSVYVGPNGQCSEICPDRIKDADGLCVLNCGGGAYADKPLRDIYGKCYACNETSNINIGTNGKCNEICANRQIVQAGTCSVSQTCDETKPLQDNNGKCYACNATDPVYVTPHGKCEVVCPNRVMTSGGYCALPCSANKPLMSVSSGKCYACSATDTIYVGQDGQCSEICSNRIEMDSYCYLKKCSSSKPLQNGNSCYACNYASQIYVGQDGPCSEVCSNRVKSPDGTNCVLPCSSDKPLMNSYGSCYACNSTYRIDVGQNGQCSEVCSGRVKTSDGYCELPCPADKPLMDSGGTCHACDTTQNVWQYSNQQCSEICSNRQKQNGACVHSCGVGVYKTRPLMHPDGVCYACDTPEGVWVRDGDCEEVCANRTKRSDGVCYLNEEEEY